MTLQESLIDQLEDAVSGKSVGRRADMLKRVADLFLSGSGRYREAETDIFDEVMRKLIATVEVAARAQFGSRLAQAPDAPANVIRLLAFDPAIEVAGKILSQSDRLSDEDLIRNAGSMSQRHLLAISKRRELKEGLTDVLVVRGDREVLVSTAANGGSRFSEHGLTKLVDKSNADDALALSLWSRPDIPRQQMMHLFRQASERLRLQLEAANPRQADDIRAAVSAASERVQAIARSGSTDYQQASVTLPGLCSGGALDEQVLARFVREKNFDGVALALSLLCDLPVGLVERILAQGRHEQVLLLTKALEFSWKTALNLIQFQAASSVISQTKQDEYFASYSRMQVKTARTALQFYRLREKANRR